MKKRCFLIGVIVIGFLIPSNLFCQVQSKKQSQKKPLQVQINQLFDDSIIMPEFFEKAQHLEKPDSIKLTREKINNLVFDE